MIRSKRRIRSLDRLPQRGVSLRHLLYQTLRRWHCHQTKQRVAVDALPLVQTDAGCRLTTWLLRHYDRYLSGAIDPDDRFRDYQNHAIHVRQGYWGRAPRVAHQWYDRMQRYLREERYADAAHAAGVISHYFTDPMQPLNTMMSQRGRVIYRPLQWSIVQSYDEILRTWLEDDLRVVFRLSDGPGWLGEAILHGARFANRKHDGLINDFDLSCVVRSPAAALGDQAKANLGELLGLAITGWARVLERAAWDAEAVRRRPLPNAMVGGSLVTALIRAPMQRWLHQMEDDLERDAIAGLVREFQRTGDVRHFLPAHVDVMQRVAGVYASEQDYKKKRERDLAIHANTSGDVVAPNRSVDREHDVTTIPMFRSDEARLLLSLDRTVVDAPSVDFASAKRLNQIGIATVGDLLARNPESTAQRLGTYWITPHVVARWCSQARLMCQVPGLRECDSVLLTGAGYGSVDAIAKAVPETTWSDMRRFSKTLAGRRAIRETGMPTLEQVKKWNLIATRIQRAGGQVRRSA